MIEKVNPQHPDKIADRIAGALVDLCYTKSDNPKCAIEVLIGHGKAYIIAELSDHLALDEVEAVVSRIAGDKIEVEYIEVPQDPELSKNQSEKTRAGDNGIFKGVPINSEVFELSELSRRLYDRFRSDGKYILDKQNSRLIICQSNATEEEIISFLGESYDGYIVTINPLGEWTGGINVDTGATNRKLGSDMGEAVTGGGLHGKDLSKADVAVNIYAHLKAQETGYNVNVSCAIGDEDVDEEEYETIASIARDYINELGGFEKLAEWGLV